MDNNLRSEVSKLEADLKKMLNFQVGKLSEVLKKVEIQKEKKCKINKMGATAILSIDNSIMIYFDDPNDGIKFFESIQ